MKDPPTNQNNNCVGVKTADASALTVNYGIIAVDLVFRKLCIEDSEYTLSPKEFILMFTLLKKEGKLVRRTELCTAIGASADDSALENHVHRLRKKLGRHGEILVSKRNCGYRISAM